MSLALLILFPLLLANVMLAALAKLGLNPGGSLLVVFGILLGGMINIPVKRIPRQSDMPTQPIGIFGLERMFPELVRRRRYTLIAVNVGGCIVPSVLVVYEFIRIARFHPEIIPPTVVAGAINIAVCYFLAKPVPHVGIALPALVPALVAAASALVFAPELAPVVAFISGVLGPLVGADLLRISNISRIDTGMASIGGAGTFDGIVISGLLATLLA
ncbi:MAG: DUF1614 domain-containing protein [Chitinivibrionales bacterium]|nr:DUF1614 domain-containing protein [Chitinivibrionales bacterium]MBD3358226.1 DUF1614 domain-containing protein [Chitinivibrionales bacterium]